ncbi:MAG: Formylglycine-rating enzyme family protein [Candidatus Poribacteria bacterium]|nr:Formylglycine-rating enzyme family protein [Candidatus Poribacteria bacterium]
MGHCLIKTSCIFLAACIIASVNGDSDEKSAKEMTYTLPGGAKIDMVWINPGTFTMGSPDSESGRESNEEPLHKVTITQGFWLGKYELTQSQWESVMNTCPWEGQVFVKKDPSHPAVFISWNDIQAFISKLNDAEKTAVYRLPTEAEWEYACRAGTNTPYSFGSDESMLLDYAWYGKNTYDLDNMYAQTVGQKLPNILGLYDMHGNVWEWVQDYYGLYTGESQIDPKGSDSGENRVFRGGSFYYLSRFNRSAYRGYNSPKHKLFNLGARLLREE